jgi:hypothetical protein
MNTITIITLAVAVLIVLGLALVLTSVKRNDSRGVGTLKRETRRKDVGKVNPDEVSGRAIERAAIVARNIAIATRPVAEVEPWSPPDVEAVGIARRQFLQLGHSYRPDSRQQGFLLRPGSSRVGN